MKLTVVTDVGLVGVDDLFYEGLDLSSCGVPADVHAVQWDGAKGHIEYIGSIKPNLEITELPSWATGCASAHSSHHEGIINPSLSNDEKIENNKLMAKMLLQNSDFAVLPDVNLSNKGEWESYRSSLRDIYMNPQPDSVFPDKPDAIWA